MKNYRQFFPYRERMRKCVLKSLMTLGFSLFLLPAMANGQNKVNLNLQKGSLTDVFTAIQKQTYYRFLYSTEDVRGIEVSGIRFSESDMQEVMRMILAGTGLTWQIDDDIISVKKTAAALQQQPAQHVITGRVVDTDGVPIAGVTVKVKNSQAGTITDRGGNFSLRVVQDGQVTVVFSFVGKRTIERVYSGQPLNIVLHEDTQQIEEVVVTGIYTRSKESFTGSTSTFTAAELKLVGNQNLLQSLKTLDPAFAIIENNEFGSDPNTLPNIEIRGKTSITGLSEEYNNNPNTPLFIVDGFESTLAYVMAMSMDRVESITILKDAASTAMYGSKAANGVVVVETRAPQMGQLRVSYSGNFIFDMPDLSDYNLMNAREKLEFEKLSLRWGSLDNYGNFTNADDESKYMKILEEVVAGVDTYWMHIPVRVGTTHRHTLFAEGGANEIRYGVGLSYDKKQGVMKGSDQENINGNIRLTYRLDRLSFDNILNIDGNVQNREMVEFRRFALMNPYLRKYDDNGDPYKSYYMKETASYMMKSPLWDWGLGSFDTNKKFAFTNNFQMEWRILNELTARARIGLGKSEDTRTEFKSPFHTDFIGYPSNETGTYKRTEGEYSNYSGELNISYGNVFNELHAVNLIGYFKFSQSRTIRSSYSAAGFVDDDYPNPNASMGYTEGTSPTYYESKNRTASYYVNAMYGYDNRYWMDFNYRMDGSSIFGVDNHFKHAWSLGVAWNMHREQFLKGTDITYLKIRGSFGKLGNQNFDDYISERVYLYSTGNSNLFGTGMTVEKFGNKNLDWQHTLDYNIGFDLEGWYRFKLNFNCYYKNSDPLLEYIGVPASTGVIRIPYNLGAMRVKGWDVMMNYQIIIKSDFMWSANFTIAHNRDEYHGFGDSLEKFNETNRGNNSVHRYYDGGSEDDIWAVRSLGIDPATGEEMFLTKDGRPTFAYDIADEVVVGNTKADVSGIIGTRLYYKGFTLNIGLRYRLGGQEVMDALYNKIENVESHSGSLGRWYNQDKRALYDRWKKPGDEARFLRINDWTPNPKTSRFVMDNNVFSGESITLTYRSIDPWVNSIGASSVDFGFYMNDIFRIATIKNERGLSYPFARTVSFRVGITF